MPALTSLASPPPLDIRPTLAHVNLMLDTFIANAQLDDLRVIIRSLLATTTPNVAAAFANLAQTRLRQTSSKSLPIRYALFARLSDGTVIPTSQLSDTLTRARSLYGAGMGFSSLTLLAYVVRATVGIQWHSDSDMADALAVVDTDISQAIQSSKEELESGRVDRIASREVLSELRSAVNESFSDVRSWGGEFPFERAVASIAYWKDH